MRFRLIYALVAALSACVVLFGAASIATGAPGNGNGSATANSGGGGGSGSTATSGPGNSSQGCDGTHHSDTGHGANQGGPYDNTCDGSPSGNGNGNGKATGKPCAGCVGNADDKNPGFGNGKGQMPNGSDHNAGYECDRNHGIGRTNPAHTGCRTNTVNPPPTCPNGQPIPPSGNCETSNPKTCPNGQPIPDNGNCNSENPKTCPNGQPMPENGNCGNNENQPPTTTSSNNPPPEQAVLGERQSSPEATPAPKTMVLGAHAGGKKPSKSATAPAAATQPRTAAATRTLPFTGTDVIAVVLAGVLMLLAGLGLRRLAAQRA